MKIKIWVIWPFQEYFTYIKPIVNLRWAKTREPIEKTLDLPVQNVVSYMCPERHSIEARTIAVRDPMFKSPVDMGGC